MNHGFIDSTFNSKRRNLQVESQSFRRQTSSDSNSTYKTLNVSRLLPASSDNRHSTLVFGARGAGGIIGKDVFYTDGTTTNNGNRYLTGQYQIRSLGEYAVDLQLLQTLGPYSGTFSIKTARGYASALLGGENNLSDGSHSGIVGGTSGTNSGTYSFIGGGSSGSNYGAFSALLGGISNYNSGYSSCIIGGFANTVGNQYSGIIAGFNNQASGQYSVALGGYKLRTKTSGEVAFGGSQPDYGRASGSLISLYAKTGSNSFNGDCEMSTYYGNVLNISDEYSILSIYDYETVAFDGTLIGTDTGNDQCKIYAIKCCARKPFNSPSGTVLLGTPVIDLLHSSSSATSWTVTVGVYNNNSFGGLKFVVNSGSTAVQWSLTGTVNRISTN